jgi:hypothetical protein
MRIPTIRLINSHHQIAYQRNDPDPCGDGVVEQHLVQEPTGDLGPFGQTDDEEVVEDRVDDVSGAGDDSLKQTF